MALTTQTNFLNLILPVPTEQLGPTWATQLNAALEVVDSHDHSSGKGVKVPTAGLNINADLDFNESGALNLKLVSFDDQITSPTGSNFASSVSTFNGDLYYTNSSGVAIQLTAGGGVVPNPGSVESFETTSVSSDLIISPTSTFVYLITDTTAPRTITLPLANSVTAGRIYIIKDASGQSNTNPVTIQGDGADLVDSESSQQLCSNFGTITVVTDGVSNWHLS